MILSELKTKLGTLLVEESGYTREGYPGFIVSLFNDGEIASVLFEVDEHTQECKVHLYDTRSDEPLADYSGRLESNNLTLKEY